MEKGYDDYKREIEIRIRGVLEEMKTQPVLFIGTGLSIRYFDAPSWESLLRSLAEREAIENEYEQLKQNIGSKPLIAEEFAEDYNQWAWRSGEDGGRDTFPPWIFDSHAPADIYLKYTVADIIRDVTPTSINEVSEDHQNEIDLLQNIEPHSVITTNYDRFIENFVFPEFERVIGQTLIEEPFANIGEIYKIHGCTTRPAEMVLTQTDYAEFDEKKSYLSAKLLTFFTEHPVLIVGYEPTDENVKRILSDVNTVLSGTDRQPNIFLVKWKEDASKRGTYNQETLIDIGDGAQMIVNYIVAEDFGWIFEAFGHGGEIKGINSKLLRKLLRNTYDIIQEEAPRREISVNSLEKVADDKNELLDILGIAPLDAEEPPSTEGSPSSIAEAGVPVGQIISNEDVDDLQEKLRVAVACWREYDVLFEQRGVIYTFYNQRENLDLSNSPIDFLLRSSLVNIIQGSEWLIRYDGDIDDLFSGILHILNGQTIPAHERNLLALGKENRLREISESRFSDFSRSNAQEYADCCSQAPGERIKSILVIVYSSTPIITK